MADSNEQRFNRLEREVDIIKEWKQKMDTHTALTERQFEYLDQRFDTLEKKGDANKKELDEKLEKLNANFGRIAWLIITAIVGAFMTWVFTGGLQRGP